MEAHRSTARGRLATRLVDSAQKQRVGKIGIVRCGLDALAERAALVFSLCCSRDLQPLERLWRPRQPNVAHSHTRSRIAQSQAGSDEWLARVAADP